MNAQPVSLSPSAASEIRRLMAEAAMPDAFLRIGVKGGGCSGLSYTMNFEAEPKARDSVLDDPSGLRLLVDPKSALFLNGTVLDFTTGLENHGFHFRNPNATRSCGCGSSFSA